MKTLFKFAFVAAIVAVVGYNVYQSQSVMNGMSEISIGDITSSVNISLLGDQIRFATKNSSISLRGDIKLYVEYSIQPKLKYLPVNDIGLLFKVFQ